MRKGKATVDLNGGRQAGEESGIESGRDEKGIGEDSSTLVGQGGVSRRKRKRSKIYVHLAEVSTLVGNNNRGK